ncbi:Septin-9 [Colletotrichum trifolii]|uniref:Septin-9 n=1 Tax=Colletotrichum trifolii TaxID=5466 RepID=A0A4R8PR41_COLTR|nr:Septin-9 [Colletotrichum trifolii]
MTPILYGVSGSSSAISSSSSRPNSLTGSQSEYQESFVMSAFGTSESGKAHSHCSIEAGQQFIMPTINIPSRRPFTDVGKSLGRLKLLVAGKSDCCPHIVHVDPTVPVAMVSAGLLPSATSLPESISIAQGTFQITETLASTKPLPPWWRDTTSENQAPITIDPGDVVIDRNICLVDTPGYQESCRPTDTASQVAHYVESHLQRSRLDGLDEDDVLRTVSEGGGLLVDAVLYVLPSSGTSPCRENQERWQLIRKLGLSAVDVEYLRKLNLLTSVIPLLAQADTMTKEQVVSSKELIAGQLVDAGLSLSLFTSSSAGSTMTSIFSISSELRLDRDLTEDSVLMGSEYGRPLVPTDLPRLLDHIFSFEGAAWLRHAAAKKLLSWRSRHPNSRVVSSALVAQTDQPIERTWLRTPVGSLASCATNRLPGHAFSEERLCRVQLTHWAADLQRSLANERAIRGIRTMDQISLRVQPITAGDGRAANNCTSTMALARTLGVGRRPQSLHRRRHSMGSQQDMPFVKPHDPLGLLQFKADLKWQDLNAIEMLSGLGIVGGLAWLLV